MARALTIASEGLRQGYDGKLVRDALESLSSALLVLSPTHVLQSTVITTKFRAFLARGSQRECQDLLPQFQLKGKETPSSSGTGGPERTIRKEKVIAAVHDLARLERPSHAQFEQLWKLKEHLLDANDTNPLNRINHLIQGIKKLDRASDLCITAHRYALVFLVHDVEHITATIPRSELAPNQTRKTVAKKKITAMCGLGTEKLGEMVRDGRKYLSIIQAGGPGALLMMGRVSFIWKYLNAEEIPLVFRIVKEYLHAVHERLQRLATLAVRNIIEGLRAYGWTDKELGEGKGPLMDTLRGTIALDALAQGRIEFRPVPSERPATDEASSQVEYVEGHGEGGGALPALVSRSSPSGSICMASGGDVAQPVLGGSAIPTSYAAQDLVSDGSHLLMQDETSLREYLAFLNAFDETSPHSRNDRKRRSIESGLRRPVSAGLTMPVHEGREMKHMYTNGPASDISKFPEPFKSFIQNSHQWKWERNQNTSSTGCWTTLFPKDDAQDVSFTIWGAHEDGYKLNEEFALQLALSS